MSIENGLLIIERPDIVNIANAIRSKTGKTNEFSLLDMPNEIAGISGGSVELPSAENAAFGLVSDDVLETGITSLSNINYESSYYYMCAINKYKANEPITIVGLRMYNYTAGGTMSLRLWNENGETLRETEQTSYPYGTWTTVYFDKSVDIALGESFYVNTSSIRNMAYCRVSNVTFNSKVTFEGSTQGGDSVPSTLSQNSVYGIVDFIIGESNADLPDSYEIRRSTMDDIAEEVQRISGSTTKLNTAQIIDALEDVKLQSKTVMPSDEQQTITPDADYYGLSSVSVKSAALQKKTVSNSKEQQVVKPDAGYYGLSSVVVEAAGDSDGDTNKQIFESVLTDKIENNIVSVIEFMFSGSLEDATEE